MSKIVISREWWIAISVMAFSIIAPILTDIVQGIPILSTFNLIFNWVLNVLIYEFPLWVYLALLILYVSYLKFRKSWFKNIPDSDPDFVNYKTDTFKTWTWKWEWFKGPYGWRINNLLPICPDCGTPLKDNQSFPSCPRCEFESIYGDDFGRGTWYKENIDDIKTVIHDNVNRKLYKLDKSSDT